MSTSTPKQKTRKRPYDEDMAIRTVLEQDDESEEEGCTCGSQGKLATRTAKNTFSDGRRTGNLYSATVPSQCRSPVCIWASSQPSKKKKVDETTNSAKAPGSAYQAAKAEANDPTTAKVVKDTSQSDQETFERLSSYNEKQAYYEERDCLVHGILRNVQMPYRSDLTEEEDHEIANDLLKQVVNASCTIAALRKSNAEYRAEVKRLRYELVQSRNQAKRYQKGMVAAQLEADTARDAAKIELEEQYAAELLEERVALAEAKKAWEKLKVIKQKIEKLVKDVKQVKK
ncbi:hypothetical protein I317_04098 [Kwoniella heveanensis CBS 569]|nr:hypothetical protein I317_04098 [Kwoniella heveanensis CBS 569]